MHFSHKIMIKSVHTTQYGIRSLRYTGANLWNSLYIDVKKIKPYSSSRKNSKNSIIDGCIVLLIPEVL